MAFQLVAVVVLVDVSDGVVDAVVDGVVDALVVGGSVSVGGVRALSVLRLLLTLMVMTLVLV